MVYVSVRGRIWLQAEAMNMVESVGNYVKHRKVPILVRKQDRYIMFFVPAISGESIAHSYQQVLAQELIKAGDKVCPLCSKGIFLKSTNSGVYKYSTGKEPSKATGQQSEQEEARETKGRKGKSQKATGEDLLEAAKEIEETIIQSCGVEDVGGFLYADEPNVKRTSSFYTGYMIPVYEVLGFSSIDPQFHSRYALGTQFVSVTQEGEGKAAGQTIYYVEVASALFTFSFDIDTTYIGKYTFLTSEYGKPVNGVDPVKRSKTALSALARFLLDFPVGAKRTRFNPADIRWESIGIAVSDDVFTMPSSFTGDYLARAVAKAQLANRGTRIHAYIEGGCNVKDIQCYASPEEAVLKAISEAISRVK